MLLDWWLGENTKGRHVWPGHNDSRAAQGGTWLADELNAQIRATRATAATGDVHFSMRALMPASAVVRDTALVGVATQPPRQAAAAALSERLKQELYRAPALIPPSPWLTTTVPARPLASLAENSSSAEIELTLTPAAGSRVAWWTVRVRSGAEWHSWILPGAQRRLVVAAAGEKRPIHALITAVDRYGTESAVIEVDGR